MTEVTEKVEKKEIKVAKKKICEALMRLERRSDVGMGL